MSNDHLYKEAGEVVVGAFTELARQSGLKIPEDRYSSPAHKGGELLAQGLAVVAPHAMATAATGTGALIAGASSVAVAAAPLAVVAAAGYAAYRLFKWASE